MDVLKLGAGKIISGMDALDFLSGMGAELHRALVVMGKGSLVRNGSLKKLQDALAVGGIECDVFMGVGADPTFSTVIEGAKKAKEFQPDAIIGFGGGSAMDAAKVIRVFYENPEMETLESVLLPNPIPVMGEKAKLICIPSTSGTGSEVTNVAVITNDTTHVKHAVLDMNLRMIPDLTLLCPEFTASMPPRITADSGMDAMTHAIEAYVCNCTNPYSDALAFGAFKNIYANLPLAYSDGGNLAYRDQMLTASCMAGIAFSNCGLGIAHSIAHALGGQYGIPHGKACALALPYVIAYNAQNKQAASRYQELAALVGFPTLQDAVCDLCGRLGIPTQLRSFFSSEEEFRAAVPKLAEIAAADVCVMANPVPANAEDFARIIGGMY